VGAKKKTSVGQSMPCIFKTLQVQFSNKLKNSVMLCQQYVEKINDFINFCLKRQKKPYSKRPSAVYYKVIFMHSTKTRIQNLIKTTV
jgi:hypothetical protein